MNQALASTVPGRGTEPCLHCGSEIPDRGDGDRSPFCCRGCSAVHAILQERQLGEYYAIRDKVLAGAGRRFPAAEAAETHAYLDDPDFLAEYSVARGREMRFYLEGVHCAACVWLTEKLPELVPGVESLRLDLSSGIASVRIQGEGRFAQAADELGKLGYRPHPVKQDEADALRRKENRRHLIQLGIAAMCSGNIMLLAVALYAGADGGFEAVFRWTSFALYLPVLLYSALPFYRSAWASLRSRQVSIDVPIVFGIAVGTVASVANLLLGSEHIYFDSLSALVFLLLSTRYLLRKVNQRALSATQLMHFLTPSKSMRLDASGAFVEVRTDALKEGDRVRVLPGECVPVDGAVVSGESELNCALLTGESRLVAVAPGSRVHAGTWNQHAPFEMRVSASGATTRLGKILAAMEEGLANKAPIVAYVDRVGQAFVVAVLVLTGVGFLLGLASGLHEAVNRALAVAIVVCPCTFALATPLAMSLAISRCARAGILIKGSDVLERMSQVRSVFFDKTGTLTYGELRVSDWQELAPGATLALLALESRSAHPIAKAVQRYFPVRRVAGSLPEVRDFEERPVFGVSGWINGAKYEIRGVIEEHPSADAPGPGPIGTRVVVRRDGVVVGLLSLHDEIRPDSAFAVRLLKSMGLEVSLLSGDAPEPVLRVARALGIDPKRSVSSAGPERKARVVGRDARSLMVGDGANDAVALASAHASVAVQGGMEMSMRAAGAYSSKPGVMAIPSIIVVARETMRVIRRNLVFAVLYNLVGIAVALTGHLDPLFAAVLMPLSALTVFLSTLAGTRALRKELA
jgi:Cu2+-exporting ATPase